MFDIETSVCAIQGWKSEFIIEDLYGLTTNTDL
jgi:hypothetical protein